MNSETCYAIEGNVVDRVSAKNGKGWCENVSPTLNTQDRHAVVYTIDALSSNSMKSANPHSGFHETNVSRCLDTSCCEPTCNQGGMVIVTAQIVETRKRTNKTIEVCGVLASSAEHAEITDGTVSPTLMARAGTGGNQLPLVWYMAGKKE